MNLENKSFLYVCKGGLSMIIYLDDIRENPRNTILARSVNECKKFIVRLESSNIPVELDIDHDEVYKACSIPMPTDQKRNMMNASSNFDIIYSILSAIREKKAIKIHTPGVDGHIGGYPFGGDTACDVLRELVTHIGSQGDVTG